MANVIETEKLTKFYGTHRGIIDVDLDVADRARSSASSARMGPARRPRSGPAGPDPADQRAIASSSASSRPPTRWRSTGASATCPGEFALYDRLTGGQTLEYFANLRGGVDRAYQAQLSSASTWTHRAASRSTRRATSRRSGLVIALQHRPELLILDEPTAGLDPLVQQTLLRLLREAVGGRADGLPLEPHPLRGRADAATAWRSSARGARQGRQRRRAARPRPPPGRAALRRAGPGGRVRGAAGVSDVVVDDHVLRLRVAGAITPVVQAAARYELLDFVSREPSLEETFLAQYGREAVEVDSDGR